MSLRIIIPTIWFEQMMAGSYARYRALPPPLSQLRICA